MQVVRYEVGQKYADHWDAFDAEIQDKIGYENGQQRLATILLYLSDVEEGGETVFPHDTVVRAEDAAKTSASWSDCARRGPAVKPKKGDGLLFWSITPDYQIDPASMHTGWCARAPPPRAAAQPSARCR